MLPAWHRHDDKLAQAACVNVIAAFLRRVNVSHSSPMLALQDNPARCFLHGLGLGLGLG
ncbi:MAG: hypothetical protein M3Y65_06510 [Pseudomonadota bacterium]|nr:hypothetical protein [Pseudomonadota bacterium]